jgi:hypothetical protein
MVDRLQLRVAMGLPKDRVLNHKFNIDDTARAQHETEAFRGALIETGVHLFAHLQHLGTQFLRLAGPADDLPADGLEMGLHPIIPGHHQGVMLPRTIQRKYYA